MLTRKGDGVCYVRCSPKNGHDHAAFLSTLRVEITGLGKANFDPYAFVAGGLYNACNQPLDSGNEHGVATRKAGESHVGFRNLDYGEFGPDTVSLPIFALSGEPLPFEVWAGMPLEGGRKLADFIYDLGSVWNTYRTAVYTLPRRLKGVTTLCFVFHSMVHLKGFQFQKLQKAYQRLDAADNNAVYGDNFTVIGGAIEAIGNNVAIEFRNMDFGPDGADRVKLCWRSELPKNAVQIIMADDRKTKRILIEINQAPDYRERVFPLMGYGDRKENHFVYLPARLLAGFENTAISAALKRRSL